MADSDNQHQKMIFQMRIAHCAQLKSIKYMNRVGEQRTQLIAAQISYKRKFEFGVEYRYDLQCKRDFNSLQVYQPKYRSKVSTPQDTLWGDFKTKYLPRLEDSFAEPSHYEAQSDFVLNFEYDHGTSFFSIPRLIQEPVFEMVALFDNVLIEEYEVNYKLWFSSEKVKYHRILKVGRGRNMIYDQTTVTK